MKRLFVAFLAGVLFALPASAAPLRLVFWNIAWFPGGHPNATPFDSVAQIVDVVPAVASLDPDIIGLTEILNEEAMEIAFYQTPGLRPQVCSVFLDDEGIVTRQQIGIASKMPAMNAWWENWRARRIAPKRGFSFAAFEPEPGRILLVYTVHLKSNRGDSTENFAMREESARQLLAHVSEMEKAYAGRGTIGVIIGGDFNTSLDDPKFADEQTLRDLKKAGFTWGWTDVPFAERITLPSKPSNNPEFPPFPDTCFDHAFFKNVRVRSARVVPVEPNPSDHRPIVFEIEIPAPPAS
ncbi:MAG: endonuclease/exonuclease/phosphatase family protein [Terrimicrobiaceae bacterium]|nr:endonuclease/exonuclease/phosphatase family protein [Terrimicrobiaceae bacterium]